MNYVFLMFLLIKKKTIKRKRMSLIRIYENELPADDFRVPIPDEIFRKYLLEEHSIEHDGKTVAYGDTYSWAFLHKSFQSAFDTTVYKGHLYLQTYSPYLLGEICNYYR